ncbi:hypothetical protein E4K66_32360 [Bradyrhizobium frederickii]|uniref:Uncharacterized protein n=1 Tax=Bradyrhizobium frederickii TaxID=2560054 RepID=A0A4Y9KV78_9BRAD|nr:hypothetical protein E4K66_32360 [Bradyrhizobium frederickii]
MCLDLNSNAVGREEGSSYSSSLRAQRSNPKSLRGRILDCFTTLAMTGGGTLPHLAIPFCGKRTIDHSFCIAARACCALAHAA